MVVTSTDSPELAELYKLLSLLSYNAVRYINEVQSADEKLSRIQSVSEQIKPTLIMMSQNPCGGGCYWDGSTCVC
jgi:hypothetical protein